MQRSPQVTISTIPDDVLLEIFKSYVDQNYNENAWHTLVHVCQKWRYAVFDSPRWLHLELRCTNKTPVKKMLDAWPALPIVIDSVITNLTPSDETNIISALNQHDLVCRIKVLGIPNSLLESAVMKKRFPELTCLTLHSNEQNAPVIPDSFLGGSAPRLQSLEFRGIPFPFPALGKLLLSATDLVALRLWDVPYSGYISPEQIVTSLSALSMLQILSIRFRCPRSRADRERQHLSPLKRLVLPSLTEFYFKGDSEYLEGIVGRIDAPALDWITIDFFNQLVSETPLLRDFLCRTAVFQEPHQADVFFSESTIKFMLSQREGMADRHMLEVVISCRVSGGQISSLAQFCSTSLPPLLSLERLGIYGANTTPRYSDNMGGSQWLEILHPFVTVRDLALSSEVARHVAPALREPTGNTAAEVLPALRRVFVDGFRTSESYWEALSQFITARQLSGHPVSVHPVAAGML